MTERVEQWICLKFCIKLEYSSAETIRMIQKATATGYWWLAASSRQHGLPCIASRAEFFWWNIKSPRWLSFPAAHIWCPATLAFPKTKITFEREEISDHPWDSGKYNRAAGGNRENYVRSQGAYFGGDWGVIVLCIVFLVSCIFFNKCLYFSYYVAGYLLDRPFISYTALYTPIIWYILQK